MPLIKFNDGIFVEVQPSKAIRESSNAKFVPIQKGLTNALDVLPKIVNSVGKSLKDAYNTLDVGLRVANAEVEIGLSFSLEGDLFVASAKAEGTITLKITFDPSSPML
jgi:hypothetical protein